MRRRMACLLLCLLFQHASAVRAEAPRNTSLLARLKWSQFRLVLGRIEVANIHSSQTRTATSGDEGDELVETLTISGDTDVPSVRYGRHDPTGSVAITVINGNRVEIDQTETAPEVVSVSFRQQPGTDMVLCIGDGTGSQTHHAPTLWHLLVTAPDACESHLLPLLELLQPSWQFGEMLSRATDELIREADASDFDKRHSARSLIAKLKSSDFSTRQQAQQQLGELGVGVLPYLNLIADSDLTREQQRRLEQVRVKLRGQVADTPERIALWLVEDERIWLSMLAHDELPIRVFAATHLAKRFEKPIDYDPEGTPLERQEQVARIRTRLVRR